MQKDNNSLLKQAKEVIESIRYLNIASICDDGKPWNTPVYISYDSNLNFWWMSWKDNQHSKNVRANSQVFCTIYDSQVREGEGFGVYFQGHAFEVTSPKEMLTGILVHYRRVNKKARAVKEFLKHFPRRVYKFVPEKVWVNGDGDINGNFIDVRHELNLKKLKRLFS